MFVKLPPPLLQSEMPPGERVKKYLLSGYRKEGQPYFHYILSYFQWHNETLNIWTHLFGWLWSLYMLYRLSCTYDMTSPALYPLGTCLLGYISMFFLSTLAHTFSNASELMHFTGFFGDFMGISVFGTAVAITSHFYCIRHDHVRDFYDRHGISVTIILNVSMYCFFCYGKIYLGRANNTSKILRTVANLLSFFWYLIPIFYRISEATPEDEVVLALHKKQMLFYILSGLLYSCHIPERWVPHKFDIVGQSHTLFHITVILSAYYGLQALVMDMEYYDWFNAEQPTFFDTYGVFFYVLLLEIGLWPSFIILADKKLQQNQHANLNKTTNGVNKSN